MKGHSHIRGLIMIAQRALRVRRAMSTEPELDDTQIRFQEAHGARLFRQGKPRALLEVKSPNIPLAMYEARLRGYDRASSKEPTSKVRKKVTVT
jgi:hypothetical protein